MNTKLDIGQFVDIEGGIYRVSKIIIDFRGVVYQSSSPIVSEKIKHLCCDQFTDKDIEDGFVEVINDPVLYGFERAMLTGRASPDPVFEHGGRSYSADEMLAELKSYSVTGIAFRNKNYTVFASYLARCTERAY